MFKAYPRHSVDISKEEYLRIILSVFALKIKNGNCVQLFERAFSEYISVSYSISIPSARLGLLLLFKYFDFPAGSEIIITPFTHWSIFTVIKFCKLKPIFVDISKYTYNIDPRLVRKVINRKTKVLILTHMWGQPCEMHAFFDIKKEFDIKIIEDCAMACGAEYKNKKVGSFGDAAIFSFGKAKAISTFGGGMLCTNDQHIYEQVQQYSASFNYEKSISLATSVINSIIANFLTRPSLFFFSIYPVMKFLNIRDPYNPIEHKKDTERFFDRIPDDWKIKLTNLQAAVGIAQLDSLDAHNEKRIENAKILNEILCNREDIQIPITAPEAKHIYLYYALLIKKNISIANLRRKLISKRIDSQLNELTSSRELGIFGVDSKDYPVFKDASENLLIIPNGIYLNRDDVIYIGDTFREIIESIN